MGLGNLENYIDENWHGGQIEGDFYTHPEMDIEENGKVEKKPNTLVWNWKHVLTRELMRGRHKPEILSKYKIVIDRFGIHDRVVAFLDKYDGFIGWFIVDVSNFDDKFCYDDIPECMRKCNLYAYNATELREIISRSLISENDGTLDGFLNSNDESIHEQINYVDDCTGLPCVDDINSIFDNDDDRLSGVADYFLGRKLMTLNERNKFVNSGNKFAFLVTVLKRSFLAQSNSNGKYSDVINDFGVKQHELDVEPQKSLKNVDISNIRETKLDDVEVVELDSSVDVKRELNKSDFKQDVTFDKVEDFTIDDIKDMKDDEFDYADVSKIDVDIDEMFEEESDPNEVEFDSVSEKIEISNKYDWSW